MPSLLRRVVAECLGTAFLLAAVVGSGIMAQRLAGGNDALALLCNTLPTGAILTVLILTLGPLSGAHFNPAVSLAFALRRELRWPDAGSYIAAQIIGGVIGVWVAHLMFELPVWQVSLHARTGAGQWLAEGVATLTVIHEFGGYVEADGLHLIDSPSPLTTLEEKAMAKHSGSRDGRRLQAHNSATAQTL